ncbi:MAG: ribosome rescue GTPase HflX [Candidatus Parabeggiatoa sp.]|nr:ribosome rescue GTPase HflX [Candidatus Parabeggiatoa sp.]
MFERPKRGERAILVSITLTRLVDQANTQEFTELAESAGAKIMAQVTGTREFPEPSTFVGSGKLKELEALVQELEVDVVLFNHTLSPRQERNLERALQCRVVDRTGLILDIFAQRARSFEGKLQVELAQLKHLSTRLVRGWTHLERQKGGIGLRGPGETQLETDRRLIAERIKFINKRLSKVSQQRELSRKARIQNQLPVVSLVGYTNAGKSTLFNRLTQANVFAADQLFATLDATLRRVILPDKTTLILADTVGFIEQLPHDLVAAFRATLDEIRLSALLLHIVDVSDPEWQLRVKQVNQVLTDIGAAEVPQILLCNKIDRLEHCPSRLQRDSEGQITQIWLSAVSGVGIDLLYDVLSKQLHQDRIRTTVRVPVEAGDLRARLFEETLVLHEQYADNGDSLLEIQIPAQYFNHLIETDSRLQPLSDKVE